MGREWAYLAMTKTDNGLKLSMCTGVYDRENDGTIEIESTDIDVNTCYLKVQVDADAVCSFYYSTNGSNYKFIGKKFTASEGVWIGAKVGLFNVNPNISKSKGFADFDWFRFE